MKTTIVEAIRQVMKVEARPMTAREVYYQIVQEGLYDFRAKDPMHVVGTQIRRHCVGKQAKSYVGIKFFDAVGKDKYQLLPDQIYRTGTPEFQGVAVSEPVSDLQSLRKQQNDTAKAQGIGLAKRTIILAIKEVMQSHGKPMTVQQIYRAIVSRDLYTFKTSQPAHVVRSQIRKHCFGLDFPSAETIKHFELRGKNKYYLLPKPVKQKTKLSRVGTASTETSMEPGPGSKESQRDQIFISYSHKDSKWLQRLRIHLRPLERSGTIDSWDDTRIRPGAKWRNEIEKAIKRARVAVLLISADFLASEFVMNNELPPLLQAAASEGATILPVIIGYCRFEKTEGIHQFQAINPPNKPLSALGTSKRDEWFAKVADEVEAALYPL